MSLSPGTKLAYYEILEPIGKGGIHEQTMAEPDEIRVVLNWFEELERLVPTP